MRKPMFKSQWNLKINYREGKLKLISLLTTFVTYKTRTNENCYR